MLLQRGQGRILSGFFKVFSCALAALAWFFSLSIFTIFDFALSSFMEGVLGLTLLESGNVSGFIESSVSEGGSLSCPEFSEADLGGES